MNHAIHHVQRAERVEPASQSFLEPRGEGIAFAVCCVVASVLVYAGVIMFRLTQV